MYFSFCKYFPICLYSVNYWHYSPNFQKIKVLIKIIKNVKYLSISYIFICFYNEKSNGMENTFCNTKYKYILKYIGEKRIYFSRNHLKMIHVSSSRTGGWRDTNIRMSFTNKNRNFNETRGKATERTFILQAISNVS